MARSATLPESIIGRGWVRTGRVDLAAAGQTNAWVMEPRKRTHHQREAAIRVSSKKAAGPSQGRRPRVSSYHLELISLLFFDLRPLGSLLGRVGWTQVAKSQKKIVAGNGALVFTPLSHTVGSAGRPVASRGRSRASKAAFTAGHRRGAGRCVIHQDHHKAAASVVGVTLDTPP